MSHFTVHPDSKALACRDKAMYYMRICRANTFSMHVLLQNFCAEPYLKSIVITLCCCLSLE